jgi:hypothetical protein
VTTTRYGKESHKRTVRADLRTVIAASLPVLSTLVAATFSFAAGAQADGQARWQFAPAVAPPPPAGVAPAPYPVAVGEVGQISFWAPNRGLLITGGTAREGGPVPAGLYAYDGVNWHLLSTVCGGGKGRIAWAGPDEFWTISDQRAGQTLEGASQESELPSRSLCHFVDGQVVASYAEPLGQADSYVEMDAAACDSPDDCWFGGPDGESTSLGSFHLHWDGSQLTTVYDSSDHAVTGMASFDGQIYEGLGIGPGDAYLPGEEPLQPPVIRTIAAGGGTQLCEGTSSEFCNVFPFSEAIEQRLPAYPQGIAPDSLAGFSLVSDGSPLGAQATQLWAGADTARGVQPAGLTILRDSQGNWTQVLPAPPVAGKQGASPFGEDRLAGSTSYVSAQRFKEPGAEAIAPVPGSESAWLSLSSPEENGAAVALVNAAGEAEFENLPGPEDHVGYRGSSGPIACAAANDCWMATSQGWLFHLTDGTTYPQDTDPDFVGPITSRPPDNGLPPVYPDLPPIDDSLANQQAAPSAPAEPSVVQVKASGKAKRLVLDVKSSFRDGRMLILSFRLTARASVRLVGKRGTRVVVSTARQSLRAGRHTLSLELSRQHWPTKFQFQAKPIGAPESSGSSGSEGSGDTIST